MKLSMKIAFVGKGGSGKSTVATLFAQYLAENNKHVLAIDADINQHFGTLLGFDDASLKNLPSLGHEIDKVRSYCIGTNTRIKSPSHFRMTTPPATGSQVVTPTPTDPFFTRYIISKDNLHFATTGEFETSDVGMICYHGKTMATEIVLNHLADKNDEYVIVDMTAGADAFSTGIFLKFDVVVLIVEPTAQSVSVYHQYIEYGKEYGICIKVVGNKIDTKEDEAFIKNHVGENYIGSLPFTKEVRRIEKNEELSSDFKNTCKETFDDLLSVIEKTPKDWNMFYSHLVTLHKKHAESWLNNSFQYRFEDQIDPLFDPVTFYSRN